MDACTGRFRRCVYIIKPKTSPSRLTTRPDHQKRAAVDALKHRRAEVGEFEFGFALCEKGSACEGK